ncbi:Nucleic acid-binding [Vigna unguiculata]|uniref:Nucleic acid-binding n=1 Tax=Vigna unguiculata TaxID=3917 RepID=A0A4D6L3L9_VIGUN|nr:Nucleic acid-binding [Vigna unguiculata]
MFKYKLQLQVCDDAFNYANFVVWDQERRNVIGISVEELQKEMIKVGEDDPKCFLDDLDVMLGCTLAFKVRTQPRNRCASVIKVSDLPEIINYIKKLIQPVKIAEFRSKGVCNLAADTDNDLEIICVIVATTIKFSLDNDGWYYFVCNHCNKRTNETGPFKCTYYDQENNIPMFKYKLQLQVCDDAFNYANFVVWDQERRNVIGISVEELQKEMIKVGEDDPKCFLDDLDVMLGCTLAFKVRTQPRNRCASVIKVSDLPEIINYIKKLIQPVKRILQNSGVFVESSQDIESSKLSATKLLKTIKKEIE